MKSNALEKIMVLIIVIMGIPAVLSIATNFAENTTYPEKDIVEALTLNKVVGDDNKEEQEEALKNKEEIFKLSKNIDQSQTDIADISKLFNTDPIDIGDTVVFTDNKSNIDKYKNLNIKTPVLIAEISEDFIENDINYNKNKNRFLQQLESYGVDEGYMIAKSKDHINVYMFRPKWQNFKIYQLENMTISKTEQDLEREEEKRVKREKESDDTLMNYLIWRSIFIN